MTRTPDEDPARPAGAGSAGDTSPLPARPAAEPDPGATAELPAASQSGPPPPPAAPRAEPDPAPAEHAVPPPAYAAPAGPVPPGAVPPSAVPPGRRGRFGGPGGTSLVPLLAAGLAGAVLGAVAMCGIGAIVVGIGAHHSRPAFSERHRGEYSEPYGRGPRGDGERKWMPRPGRGDEGPVKPGFPGRRQAPDMPPAPSVPEPPTPTEPPSTPASPS